PAGRSSQSRSETRHGGGGGCRLPCRRKAMPHESTARTSVAVRQAMMRQEANEVIAALRALGRRVSSVAIRDCLEAARSDIAYAAAAPLVFSTTVTDEEDAEEDDCV